MSQNESMFRWRPMTLARWAFATVLTAFQPMAFAAAPWCASVWEPSTRAEVWEAVRTRLTQPRLAIHLNDVRNAQWIESLKPRGAVALLVGNHTEISRHENLERYAELARQIADSGRIVLYDADATSAEVIRSAAGRRAIGISAIKESAPDEPLVVRIHNMHLRMEALGEKLPVIAGTDSLTGMGLAIHRKAAFIFDVNGNWKNALTDWTRSLESSGRNLGIKFKDVPVLKSIAQLNLSPVPAFDVTRPTAFSRLSKAQLVAALDHASAIETAEDQGGATPGAVIFGSAKVDPASAQIAYNVSYALGRLGIAGTTGGAGGAMWIANAGFHDAGAASIGLPIVGRNQLKAESKVHEDVQTASVGVPNYHVRVYELLNQKYFVGFVPGGSGTMRELAATMLMLAPDPREKVVLGFVDPGYYGGLTQFLRSLPLPVSFKNRLVDSVTPDSVPVDLARVLPRARGEEKPAPRQPPTFSLTRFQSEAGAAGD